MKKSWIIIIIGIVFASGIVLAGNYLIHGHETDNIEGLRWHEEGKVGALEKSINPKPEGGHTSEELEDVVWFDKEGGVPGEQEGVVLKEGASAQVELVALFRSATTFPCQEGDTIKSTRVYFYSESQIKDGRKYISSEIKESPSFDWR